MNPGSLLKPVDLIPMCGSCNIGGPHFQLHYGERHTCTWPGTHIVEKVYEDDKLVWRYIKWFPPGEFSEGRRVLTKLENLWPCSFLAKEYPQ
jgi:hypothetical protein